MDGGIGMCEGELFERIVAIMKRLRSPDGCPWDRKQTFQTLTSHVIEEAYELVDALDKGDKNGMCEESGDLLLQVVFISQLAEEEGFFDIAQVLKKLEEKLIRRHPHVFGDARAADSDEARRNWDRIKASERADKEDNSVIAGVPRSIPALLRAFQIQERAARVGFDWPKEGLLPLWEKISEETEELKRAIEGECAEEIEEEVGDLLFATVNLSRHLGIDPERALQRTNEKFSARFRFIEERVRESGRQWSSFSLEELDSLWRSAKTKT